MPNPTLLETWQTIVREQGHELIGGEIEETLHGHGIYRARIDSFEFRDGRMTVVTNVPVAIRLDEHNAPKDKRWVPTDGGGERSFVFDLVGVSNNPPNGVPQTGAHNRLHFTGFNKEVTVYRNTDPELLPELR